MTHRHCTFRNSFFLFVHITRSFCVSLPNLSHSAYVVAFASPIELSFKANNDIPRNMAPAPANQPTIKLNNGLSIPQFGLGTWKSQPGEVTQAVKDAIDVGYRHIDGALVYENEHEVGAGIRAKIDEGVIKREDIFVTSKLWNTYHHPESVEKACRKTLSDLGLDYLDLYLIHYPMAWKEGGSLEPVGDDGKVQYNDVSIVDTWKAMEKLVGLGLVKSIGISNFNSVQVQKLLDNCTIVPANNQIECHPYLNQKKLVEFCKSKGITVTAYSPFGSPDRPWAKPGEPKLLEDPKILEIAKAHGKSPAQVILRWLAKRDLIVIPKSVNKNRMAQNLDVFDFEITQAESDVIDSIHRGWRAVLHANVGDHPEYPFAIEF